MVKISRANFLPASLIAYFIGAAYAHSRGYNINTFILLIGFIGVGASHLAGNLFNEYFDYKNGADKNSPESPFSGGSKLIDRGIYKPRDVLMMAVGAFTAALVCGLALFFIIKDYMILILALSGGALLIEYTAPPLKLAYNKLGEAAIFLSFGVLLVLGGSFIFSKEINFGAVLISLPIAFLVTAVILCNQMPDYETDAEAGKSNLIHIVGKNRGWAVYLAAVFLSYISILANIAYGSLPSYLAISGVIYLLGVRNAFILRKPSSGLDDYISASSGTVTLHAVIGALIILALALL